MRTSNRSVKMIYPLLEWVWPLIYEVSVARWCGIYDSFDGLQYNPLSVIVSLKINFHKLKLIEL